MARSVPKFLGWGAMFIVAIASLVSASVYVVTYHPDPIENEAIISTAAAPQAKPGQQLKVLSWNVQFFAGRPNNKFFFDGGTDPWPSKRMVNSTARAVANIIKQEDPDIIFLQELDDGAERTRYHDQLQQLLDLLPAEYTMHTSSFYWLADYVPHGELLGGVGMKMSIISRYRIEQAKRYALPNITTDDIFTQQFKPKRAVHGVYLPIEGGGRLNILNTHLSAYAQGTNTMELQVASVGEVLRNIEANGESAILAGDFNLVPTSSAYQALGPESRRYYNPAGTEITPLLDRYESVPSLPETLGDDRQDWFTHIANDNRGEQPDKTIDYIFYSGELILGDHYVRSMDTMGISDHLPIVASFTLPSTVLAETVPVADTLSNARSSDGHFISWHEHIIDDPAIGGEPDLSGSDGLAMADLNGDGFEDIVSVHESDTVYDGKPQGFVRIAWGTGDPNRWTLSTLASGSEAAGAEDVSIADANGDGHPDIIVACELAHLIYFQNPGHDAQKLVWKRTIPRKTTDRGSYIRVYFADFDHDGHPEVVAANKGDQDGAGESQGERELKNVSIFILPEDPLNGDLWREQLIGKLRMPVNAEPVDIDADGDLDIVVGTRGEKRILWYENLGEMRFFKHDILISGLSPDMTITGFNLDYTDIDGDGRLDIVANAWFNSLVWLRQPAEFDQPWEATLIGEISPDFLSALKLADIDNDGDLDVFSGAYSRGPRDLDDPDIGVDDPLGRIAWFENPGLSQDRQWTRHDISRRKRAMYDEWLARDMDDDGDLDMVGTRGNSFPFDGVIWLEQVRTSDAQAAFKQARDQDSEQMPLPTNDQ